MSSLRKVVAENSPDKFSFPVCFNYGANFLKRKRFVLAGTSLHVFKRFILCFSSSLVVGATSLLSCRMREKTVLAASAHTYAIHLSTTTNRAASIVVAMLTGAYSMLQYPCAITRRSKIIHDE